MSNDELDVKKHVPILRFGGFYGVWEGKKLGQYLSFKNGVNADKSSYGYGYKFINVLDIISGSPITHESILGKVQISDKEFEKNEVKYGDLLFQRSSETREEAGQTNVYLDTEKTATFGGFVIRGRPKIEFDSVFFYYLLQTQAARKDITNRSGGSTRFNVGQESLSAVLVNVCPSLPEQQKIAAFLSAVDNKLAALRRKHALLQTYKRGVMQKIFSQQIRFKPDDGGAFPNWEEKRLGDVASIERGKFSARPRNDPQFYGGDIPFVQTGDIVKASTFITQYSQTLNEKGLLVSKLFEPKTILISIAANIGDVAITNFPVACPDSLVAISASKEINYMWLYFQLSTRKAELQSFATQNAQANINLQVLKPLTIHVPTLREQQKIANFLTALDRKIEAVAQQVQATEQFKKGLLQQMFI